MSLQSGSERGARARKSIPPIEEREARAEVHEQQTTQETLQYLRWRFNRDVDDPFEYFDWEGYDRAMGNVVRWIENRIQRREYSDVVRFAQDVLEAAGIPEANKISTERPATAIAIAEACNLAAKAIDPGVFYALKPALVIAAWKLGARFGQSASDGAYYLFDPAIGTVSFHDPHDEISNWVEDVLKEKIPRWEHRWSGIMRQEYAFHVLRDLADGEDSESLRALADETAPPDGGQKVYRRHTRRAIPPEARARIGDIVRRAQTEET